MIRVLKYILNAPYTAVGLLNLLFCVPYKLSFAKDALVFTCLTCGLAHVYGLGVRGFATGNIAVVRRGQGQNIIDHELVHIEQYMRHPFIFGFLYLWESRRGYWKNKFEAEAYDRTNTWPNKAHIGHISPQEYNSLKS